MIGEVSCGDTTALSREHIVAHSVPGLVVVASYLFLLQYIDFAWPLVATQSDSKLLVSTGLATLKPRTINVDWGLTSAASVLSMVPVTLVFLAFQRWFVQSVASSGLKG